MLYPCGPWNRNATSLAPGPAPSQRTPVPDLAGDSSSCISRARLARVLLARTPQGFPWGPGWRI